MLEITSKAITRLRDAAREIGEETVTLATSSGVITFDFGHPHETRAHALGYETQPTRQQLAAMLGRPSLP